MFMLAFKFILPELIIYFKDIFTHLIGTEHQHLSISVKYQYVLFKTTGVPKEGFASTLPGFIV